MTDNTYICDGCGKEVVKQYHYGEIPEQWIKIDGVLFCGMCKRSSDVYDKIFNDSPWGRDNAND